MNERNNMIILLDVKSYFANPISSPDKKSSQQLGLQRSIFNLLWTSMKNLPVT